MHVQATKKVAEAVILQETNDSAKGHSIRSFSDGWNSYDSVLSSNLTCLQLFVLLQKQNNNTHLVPKAFIPSFKLKFWFVTVTGTVTVTVL